MFKLIAIALPIAGLALVEIGLRLAGYGYATEFFLAAEVNGTPVWTENPHFGWRFFPPKIARQPQPVVVTRQKPADTVRIVVLGESAAMGDPEPAYAFGRYLEVLLGEAFPGKNFEVVNAAMTAINSHALRLIARDSVKLNADFWVLYIGNNEVVGPYGAGTVFTRRVPESWWVRSQLFLQNFKTAQWAQSLGQRLSSANASPTEWGGLEMFLENKVRFDDPQLEKVYAHFERNLADILETGRRAGVKMLVATVAANLKDCAPFASLHPPDWPEAQHKSWQAAVNEGIRLAAAGKHQEALNQWQKALDQNKDYAELQYRVAESQWALGQYRAARITYQEALDLDALRFRVDSRLNGITRRLAEGKSNSHIWLVDAERAVARASRQQVPGRDLFWDHVHLNFDGNYHLARAVAESLARLLPPEGRTAGRPAWPSATNVQEKLALTDWDRLQVITEMRRRVQRPPFTLQLNHQAQAQFLRDLEQSLKTRLTPQALAQQAGLYEKALARRPNDPILLGRHARLLEEAGNLPAALAQWRKVEELIPHAVQPVYCQANLLRLQGKAAEALAAYQRALQMRPDAAEAWNGIGLCELDAGRLDKALECFQRAVREQPRDADFHYNLAIALLRLGQTNQAEAAYRQALAVAPEHASARFNLANLLIRDGRWAEAEKELQVLVEQAPEHDRARNNYGLVLLRLGRPNDAAAQFREAVRLQPENWEARLNLANTLCHQKQWDEAIPHLEAILARQPQQPAVRQKLEEARKMKSLGNSGG